ncbi:CinA family protein [Spiroplasma alleghenense]|uniref:Competence damage-inducible protein A n=1 Tax=Spiroplasma alleghenense TaxID=216931 RepID=A0A345Z484_9MOLU|nr:nicotinamide-nucleotide amidohydrolase family protein [Spiroplasma alleghenense]AXK51413.1 competence damage-inducible protein A [Spiroplasma alleghenense]
MRKLLKLLKFKNLTLSSCESFTGGLFGNKLTDISGASEVFLGGIVAYSVESKKQILGITSDLINKFTTVSNEVAIEMAISCRKIFNSDIAISFTGNAGPNASDNKDVGLAFIGIVSNNFQKVIEISIKNKSRKQFKKLALKICKNNLINYIKSDFADKKHD